MVPSTTAATPQLAGQIKSRIMKDLRHPKLLELVCRKISVKLGAEGEWKDEKKTFGPWKSKSGRVALGRTDIGSCYHPESERSNHR